MGYSIGVQPKLLKKEKLETWWGQDVRYEPKVLPEFFCNWSLFCNGKPSSLPFSMVNYLLFLLRSMFLSTYIDFDKDRGAWGIWQILSDDLSPTKFGIFWFR